MSNQQRVGLGIGLLAMVAIACLLVNTSPPYLEEARRDLNFAATAILVEQIEIGEHLESSDQFVQAIAKRADELGLSATDYRRLARDQWGNEIRFARRKDGLYIYSFGPNETDDEMGGDDIWIRRSN